MDSGKGNSKACDQCYRCKVKCTMEQSGCARCRMTKSVCTYSLGKWMGRPKKSRTRRPSSAWMRREVSDVMEGRKLHQRARSISSVENADNDDGDDDEGNEGRCGSGMHGSPCQTAHPLTRHLQKSSTKALQPLTIRPTFGTCFRHQRWESIPHIASYRCRWMTWQTGPL